MRAFATDVVVCVFVYVCLCVGHDCELCKNGGTDRDAVRDVDSCGFREPCIGCAVHVDATWQIRLNDPCCRNRYFSNLLLLLLLSARQCFTDAAAAAAVLLSYSM